MRIALVAYGTRGDVQPLLALSHGLQEAGHVPVVCVAPDFGDWVRQAGVEFHPLGSPMQHFFALGERGHLNLLAGLRRELAQHVRQIESAVKAADLILWSTAEVAVPTISEALGIPNRYVAFCPQTLYSPAHAPPFVPWASRQRWVNELTWGLTRVAVNLFGRKLLNGLRDERGLPRVDDVFGHAIPARAILAADPILAPAPPDLAGAVFQTGAWFLPQEGELDPRLEQFLAEGEPPVYLGFGSMTDRGAARTRQLLLDVVAEVGCRAVLAGGGPEVERVSPQVLSISAAPHGRLFPRVAAAVHHGGAGTTTAAARAGAAQVIVPHLLDQFYWAQRIHALGAGPAPIRRSRLSAPRLVAAIRSALQESTRGRARELSRDIRGDGVARAVQFVERGLAPERERGGARDAQALRSADSSAG